MRFIAIGLLVLCALLAALPPSYAREDHCTQITANGLNNWFPFSYRDLDGSLKGIVPDILQEATHILNVPLSIRGDRTWQEILNDLASGEIDIVLGAYRTPERTANYLFTPALGKDELRIFTKYGQKFTFTGRSDLIGKTGAILAGSKYGAEFDRFAQEKLTLKQVPYSEGIAKALMAGTVDYGILGYIEGLSIQHDLGVDKTIEPLDLPLQKNEVFVLMNKNSPCANLFESLSQTITLLQKQGRIRSITEYHLSLFREFVQ